jgi:hypothetical protein
MTNIVFDLAQRAAALGLPQSDKFAKIIPPNISNLPFIISATFYEVTYQPLVVTWNYETACKIQNIYLFFLSKSTF